MKWFGAVIQQTITLANVDPDLCHHMMSLRHSELIILWLLTNVVNFLSFFFPELFLNNGDHRL